MVDGDALCQFSNTNYLINCPYSVVQDMHSKMNQIAHLLGQLMTTTNPEPNIPLQVISPAALCPAPAVQPLTSSSLVVKRVRSRKLQAKLRTSSADEIHPSNDALDPAVLKPSITEGSKDLSQYSGPAVVSSFNSCPCEFS